MKAVIKKRANWILAGFFLFIAIIFAGPAFLGVLISLGIVAGLLLDEQGILEQKVGHEIELKYKIIVVVAGLLVIAALASGSGGTGAPSNADIEPGISQAEYDELQSDYNSLEDDYQNLQSEYNELQSDYNSLEGDYENIQSEYNNLQSNYDSLESKWDSIHDKSQYAVYPPYVVAEERNYKLTYETLEGEYRQWQYESEALESQVQAGYFLRSLSYSQMEWLDMEDYTSKFEGNSKYRKLDDYGMYYQYEPFVVESNFPPISKAIFDRHETDKKRVRAVWHFVTQLNTYTSEIEETPRFPLETLLMRGGDCEDSAILTASMLKAMPEDWTVQLVYMDAKNPNDPQEINHVAVYVDTGKYQTIIETTSSEEMTPYDSVDGFYVDA